VETKAAAKSTIEKINKNHRESFAAFKKGARLAFENGNLLLELQQKDLSFGEPWEQYVKENFCFSVRQANTYIRVYLHYKDDPKLLVDMTIQGALNAISRPPPLPAGPVVYGTPDKQLEFDWEASFNKPTVSKVKLENYRFECPDTRSLWLVRRGIPVPEKIMDLRLDKPQGELKFHYDEMMRAVQGAVEQYYLHVEKTEEAR
jgi:hypothetical protein